MSFARPASGSQHAERSSDPVGFGLRVAAAVLLVAAGALHPARLLAEAFVTIRPFAAVGGVIGLGFVAVRLGAFGRIASLVTHERVPTWAAVLGVLVWTAALSGLVNLDVAVVVAVPLALNVAGRRGLSPALIAIMVANLVNAASFLLPTSNLTNLLILSRDPLPAAAYLRGSLPAWLAVVGVTVVAGLVLLRAPGAAAAGRAEVRWSLGGVALDLATMFVLVCALRALVPAGIALPGGSRGRWRRDRCSPRASTTSRPPPRSRRSAPRGAGPRSSRCPSERTSSSPDRWRPSSLVGSLATRALRSTPPVPCCWAWSCCRSRSSWRGARSGSPALCEAASGRCRP